MFNEKEDEKGRPFAEREDPSPFVGFGLEAADFLAELFTGLSPRERKILREWVGERRPLDAIARELNITPHYAYILGKEAISKCRRRLRRDAAAV